jgi:hypothetical protein
MMEESTGAPAPAAMEVLKLSHRIQSDNPSLPLSVLLIPWAICLNSFFLGSLADEVVIWPTVLIYLIPQLAISGLSLLLRKNFAFVLGSSLGTIFTTSLAGYWELGFRTGPNSMPFFGYFFLVVPVIAGGVVLAHALTSKSLALGKSARVAILSFSCTSLAGWIYLIHMVTNGGKVFGF